MSQYTELIEYLVSQKQKLTSTERTVVEGLAKKDAIPLTLVRWNIIKLVCKRLRREIPWMNQ